MGIIADTVTRIVSKRIATTNAGHAKDFSDLGVQVEQELAGNIITVDRLNMVLGVLEAALKTSAQGTPLTPDCEAAFQAGVTATLVTIRENTPIIAGARR